MPERSTRDALMDAALELLEERGVLAGLNLREVAERVGVTPANIYHLFGSRQGLLRAALQRETDQLASWVAERPDDYVPRRLEIFDMIVSSPRLALTALLALDGDPGYRPFPFLESTRVRYEEQVARGDLPPGLDVEATHVLGLATSIAVAIYGNAAAQQLGIDSGTLRTRLRALHEQMLRALLTDLTTPDDRPR
jgi:AcrR family transcriptional regulator